MPANNPPKGSVYAQSPMYPETLLLLKMKTGEPNTNDALNKAVAHYLKCNHTVQDMYVAKK